MSVDSPIPEAAQLLVKLDVSGVDANELKPYATLQRATAYLAGAMIFLQDNVLLKRQLTRDDIKSRLLGHWGTCPGINLVYAHTNRLINIHKIPTILITGPGHGAPANLANLYLEGSLTKFYPEYSLDSKGLGKLVKGFSWPGGFPSHVNSQTPGQIHEGGELGYALAVGFGAALDNPDLLVVALIGDGEAETGPTATAWHAIKYLDPKESGAVLPILHLNGFKISEKTIFGCMDNNELAALFTGYGYQVRVVGDNLDDIQADMAVSMDWAFNEIRKIQRAARSGNPIYKPRWPMIILRSPKGWTGPKEAHGLKIEGTFRAHQVPLPNAKKDDEEFQLLNDWLRSYNVDQLFDENGAPIQEILQAIPPEEFRMGQRPETYANYTPLDLAADWKDFGVGDKEASEMKAAGKYLLDVTKRNPKRFRIFSPDEMVSNKLDAVFDATSRNFEWDSDVFARNGRVIEILSEHTLQGLLQGYTLTGRVGLFPSYEAFLGIVTTMMVQYSKFVKMSMETEWREKVGSLNYIMTSTVWRQEHNGFSHQNPAFINNLVNMKSAVVRVYLPPDANCFVCTLAHCLKSKNYVNLMVGSKQPTPVWLSPEDAEAHCIAGASMWKAYSTDEGRNPDVILVGCGVEITFEVIAAAALLRQDAPSLRVRVVNVTDLMVLAREGGHPHALNDAEFANLFTHDKPIVFNFHGYPSVVKQLLFDRHHVQDRLYAHGYEEEGTTTTPFRQLTANHCSRYDLAIDALRSIHPDGHRLIDVYQRKIKDHIQYIEEFGQDPEYLAEMPQF